MEGHVIGNNVLYPAHTPLRELLAYGFQLRQRPDFGIDPLWIDRIIPMYTPRHGFEYGRGIDRSNAQFIQIGNNMFEITKGKAAVKLEPVGGNGIVHNVVHK